ncbi:MAG: extracellular solute-binding protein [Sinimarinibacterium sp.]|jgi:arabinogalactan oligomer/maltooligosaccharide transport system substrate-binding protein
MKSKLLVAAMAAIAGVWAAQASAAATALTVWHAYRGLEKEAFEKVVATYNRKMAGKGVEVTTLAVPYDAYADKITAAVPRGKGPDVFIFAQDRLGGWVEGGKTVEPISFYLDDATRGQFLPTMLDAMTYRGTVYGLPLNYKSITLIYNTKLVKTPPATSGELVKLARSLTDAPVGKFGLVYAYNDYYYHAALQNAFGGRAFDPGPKPTLNAPENIAAMDLLLRWANTDRILPAEPSSALVTSLFNEGKAAMVFSGPWFLGEIAAGVDYALAPLPTIDEAGGKPMRPWLTIEGVYVSQSSAHKDHAYELARYLASEEAGVVLTVEGRQLHANKAVYAHKEVADDPVLAAFRKQLDNATPMPNFAEMTVMWSPATTAMNTIVRGAATPKVALDKAQASVEKDIAALRKGR